MPSRYAAFKIPVVPVTATLRSLQKFLVRRSSFYTNRFYKKLVVIQCDNLKSKKTIQLFSERTDVKNMLNNLDDDAIFTLSNDSSKTIIARMSRIAVISIKSLK